MFEDLESLRPFLENGGYFLKATGDAIEIAKIRASWKRYIKIKENEISAFNEKLKFLETHLKTLDVYDQTEKLKYAESILLHDSVTQMINIETIKLMALSNVNPEKLDITKSKISYEWIKTFDGYAAKVKNETLKKYWADLLTKKIEGKNISKSTLEVINRLEPKDVEMFNKICENRTSDYIFNDKDFLKNVYGLTLTNLMKLQDVGLLRSAGMFFGTLPNSKDVHQMNILIPNNNMSCVFTKKVSFGVNYFTTAGTEISNIIKTEVNRKLKIEMIKLFKPKGLLEIRRYYDNNKQEIIYYDGNLYSDYLEMGK